MGVFAVVQLQLQAPFFNLETYSRLYICLGDSFQSLSEDYWPLDRSGLHYVPCL